MQSLRQSLTRQSLTKTLTKTLPTAAYAHTVSYPPGYPSTSENLRINDQTKVVFQGFVCGSITGVQEFALTRSSYLRPEDKALSTQRKRSNTAPMS